MRASGRLPRRSAPVLGGQHHARRAVVDLRRVAGGDRPALAEHRLELGQALQRGVGPRPLVDLHHRRLAAPGPGRPHRHDLAVEASLVACGHGAAVGLQREAVLVGPGDLVALGHVLRRLAHPLGGVHLRKAGVDEAPADSGVGDLRHPAGERAVGLELHQRRPAHRFHAAGQHQVGLAQADRARGLVDRLQPRRAQAVHRHARDLHRQPGQQQSHASHVAVVLSRLVGVPEEHFVDRRRVDLVALHRGGHHPRGEVVGTHARQRAAVAPHRGPHRIDHERLAHSARNPTATLAGGAWIRSR